MEQRPLRLGDILDDYCPRERRVTNHAIVAMIEEDVRQTRCTTCDAEHAYKGGKAPRRRKKESTTATLYHEVLAGMPDADAAVVKPALAPPVVVSAIADAAVDRAIDEPDLEDLPAPGDRSPDAIRADAVEPPPVEEGPVHRPLIRATLPRPEGQKEVRREPDFTMRQPIGRGRFRGGDMRMRQRGGHGASGTGNGNGQGNRSHGAPRFGGPRPSGQGGGQNGRLRGGGGRKRGR
jgi:hypothetical protein